MTWQVLHRTGSAAEHHGVEPDFTEPSLWRFELSAPAAALGSTQDLSLLSSSVADQFEVVRRRSGGGLVLMNPGEQLWVDVVLPRSDPRWNDDVGVAAGWLGAVWARALARTDGDLGASTVHDGPSVAKAEGRVVCFAGTGAGEVLIADRKAVGISQRRTRDGARFQCVVFRSFDVEGHRAAVADGHWTEGIERRLTEHVAVVSDLDGLFSTFVEQLAHVD